MAGRKTSRRVDNVNAGIRRFVPHNKMDREENASVVPVPKNGSQSLELSFGFKEDDDDDDGHER